MALSNEKKKVARSGYYVAVRRDTGVYWCVSSDHYHKYGEDYERGEFYHDFDDAAKTADECNELGRSPNDPEPDVISDDELVVPSSAEKKTVASGSKRKDTAVSKGK